MQAEGGQQGVGTLFQTFFKTNKVYEHSPGFRPMLIHFGIIKERIPVATKKGSQRMLCLLGVPGYDVFC